MMRSLYVSGLLAFSAVGCGAGGAECARVQSALEGSVTRAAEADAAVKGDDVEALEEKLRAVSAALAEEQRTLRAVDTEDHRLNVENMSEIAGELSELLGEAADLTAEVATLRNTRPENMRRINEAGAAFDAVCEVDPDACATVKARKQLLEAMAENDGPSDFMKAIAPNGLSLGAQLEGRIRDLGHLATAAEKLTSDDGALVAAARALATALQGHITWLRDLAAADARLEAIATRTDELLHDAETQVSVVKAVCE